MTKRDQMLRLLRGSWGYTSAEIGLVLDMPPASVRRTIGELRALGWVIERNNGFFRLIEPTRG